MVGDLVRQRQLLAEAHSSKGLPYFSDWSGPTQMSILPASIKKPALELWPSLHLNTFLFLVLIEIKSKKQIKGVSVTFP